MTLSAFLPESVSEVNPTVRPGTVVRRIGLEAVIWSDLRQAPAHLDAVATVMIDVIDGVATTAELIQDIQAVLDIDHFAARAQVKRVLSLFDNAGALTSSAPSDRHAIEGRALLPEPNW